MRSSYIENNYGSVFRSLIIALKPDRIVECGVLDGYSLFNIAHAVRFNKFGYIYAYDLWENYKFKHGSFEEVAENLKKQKVDKYVTLAMGE